MIFRLARDDQRRARFIDQNRIDFIDNREIEAALDPLRRFEHHVVAQIIEAEFVVGAVRDIRCIRSLFAVVIHLRQIDAGRQAEPAVQPSHAGSVTLRQIVVDGNDVHALAGQAIQVRRQSRHQGFALAGTHFCNLALVYHHAADQLDIEMAHLEHPLAGFAAHRKRFRQQVVNFFAIGNALPEGRGLGLQLRIREFFHLRFKRIDLTDGFLILLEQALVATAENLGQ